MKKKLITDINKSVELINNKNRTGCCDYVVLSPTIIGFIKNMDTLQKRRIKIEKITKIIYENNNNNRR